MFKNVIPFLYNQEERMVGHGCIRYWLGRNQPFLDRTVKGNSTSASTRCLLDRFAELFNR